MTLQSAASMPTPSLSERLARFDGLLCAVAALAVLSVLIAPLALDHFGWIGFPEHAVSPSRMAGAMLMMGGVLLIRR